MVQDPTVKLTDLHLGVQKPLFRLLSELARRHVPQLREAAVKVGHSVVAHLVTDGADVLIGLH